jgi:hypothetical protein
LTGSIAHELNQPLTGILSNAQAAEMLIAADRWDAAELTEILTDIVADTQRAGDVIRNLRHLYRGQTGKLLPVDLGAVVEETERLLHNEIVAQGITLATEAAQALPKVLGNAIQLQQVLVNLIMNGIQAMRDSPPGEVRGSTRLFSTGSSSRWRPGSRTAPAWAWRSARRSSRPTVAGCGPRICPREVPGWGSPSRRPRPSSPVKGLRRDPEGAPGEVCENTPDPEGALLEAL